jgi:hypothetical protein
VELPDSGDASQESLDEERLCHAREAEEEHVRTGAESQNGGVNLSLSLDQLGVHVVVETENLRKKLGGRHGAVPFGVDH